MQWYQSDIYNVLELLETGLDGLPATDAEARLKQKGFNELKEGDRRNKVAMLLAQFKDVMTLILLAAATISGLIGDIADSIAIIVIVLLNAILGFYQEYRADEAMQALKKMSVAYASVLRDKTVITLPATHLVPGDIVLLETGNSVPADIRLTESVHLKTEEAALTGESQPVNKITHALHENNLQLGDQKNMVFKGTFVAGGRGRGVVVATGMDTELGRIAKMLLQKEAMTPLQHRMKAFAWHLSELILFICILFFLVSWLRGEELVRLALTSISLAVAAIPEALPAVIMISLALAAKRMIRMKTLIRKLSAVETLGSVTYICTDKTGTLTKNKMHVEKVFLNGSWHERNSLKSVTPSEKTNLFLLALALNNDAIQDQDKKWKGDSTEIALLELANELNVNREHFPRLAEIAFDSERKLMTTFHRHHHRIISFIKGAPDSLLQRCVDVDAENLLHQVEEMASCGLRILGFAYRYWDSLPENANSEVAENKLHFLGFTGMIDSPRDEVFEAVEQCKNAGIVPVMITGDHPLTAKAIAQRTGIIRDENDLVISGNQLSALSFRQFLSKVEMVKVYARVSPEQKLQIVEALQQKGQYVAMTGDGVNDAPSLKKANIGIAMGITGTDVSKEAADMILLDDNFSTIVGAVEEGRRVYDNILKFIKYLMTTNSGEILILLLGPLIGLPVALLPIHILWINLVSDGLPAISLSFEKSERGIMMRPPRPPLQSVFAEGRSTHIIWVGILMAGIVLLMQAWAMEKDLPWQTLVFNTVCLIQMGHVLAIRSEKRSLFKIGLFSNKYLIASVFLTILFQILITYLPPLQAIFKTSALSFKEFLIAGIAFSLVFSAVEIEKYISNKIQSHKFFSGLQKERTG